MGALAAPAFKDLTTMTIEEKTKAYKIKVNKLIKEIEEILNSHLSKSKQSDKITARLREEYIFAKNSYIKKFNNTSLVTIDPYSEDVKPKLEEGDIEGTEDDEYSKIHANSFGPFNPVEYFKKGNFRILWILKEPYVKNGEYEALIAGLREFLGWHDQGYEYYRAGWKTINYGEERNPTIANLIKISKVILGKQGEIFNENDEGKNIELVMNHICIIEVNHFPGLALKGTDSDNGLLKDWLEINNALINLLIEFYKSNIYITNREILSLYVEGYDIDYDKITAVDIINFMTSKPFEITSSKNGYPSAKIFGKKIKPYFNEGNISINEKRNTKYGPVAIYDILNKLWVGWYHTSARNEMSDINIQYIGSWINELIKNQNRKIKPLRV